MKKKDQTYQNRLEALILRHENATREGRSEYFDVDELEMLIDHYMESDQYETAQAIVQLGISLHPNNTNLIIDQAKIHLFVGNIKEAESLATYLQKIEPTNMDVQILEGQLLLANGKKEEAKVLFDNIIKQDIDFTYDVAYAYFDAFDYASATDLFEKELKLHPKDAQDILFDLAFCYQQGNDLDKAISTYEKFLDEDPYSKDTWFNLGQIHLFRGDLEKAIEALDYAYIVGNDYQALLQKGNVLFQSGKLQSAIEAYEEYISSQGRVPFVIVFLGECHEKIGAYAKAKEYYSEALSNDPTNTSALCGMCICLMEQDEYEKGIQFIDRAIEIDPTLAEAWLYKAEGHLNLGDTNEALRCYEKAADLEPEMSEALFAIGNIYIDLGLYHQALHYYKRGGAIDPTNDRLPLFFAITHFKLDHVEEAHDYLVEALFKLPESRDIFFEICPEAKCHDSFISLFKGESHDNTTNDINSYLSSI